MIAAFVLGIGVGAAGIGFALWSTGTLQTAYAPPWKRPLAPQTAPAPPAGDTSASAQLQRPPVPPPENPAASEGSADRSAPDLRLGMPIVGVDPQKLADTFQEARGGHPHEALDIPAPRGTPVRAVAEGNVAKLFNSKDGGLTVYQFDDTQQYNFYYAHLDSYAPGLKEGMLLRKGDTIGYVGTTGDAPQNSPHLHFAVFRLGPEKQWWKGEAVDPLPMLR
jgi:murein DD-endopeptidase MepM/ murein hydrolase activator NlpD